MTLNQRWAATVLGALVQAGVRQVVVAPGSRSTPLALAAADRPDVKTWPVIDERVAGFFALGLAKGAQEPVAVICTSGTAGAHLLPALIEAHEFGVPLVAVTADRPWELHDAGAAQTIDQRGLFGRWASEVTLGVPEEDPAVFLHLAARIVSAIGRAGRAPVHVNVPLREPLAPEAAEGGPVINPAATRFVAPRSLPDVSGALALIERAERGVIVCGPRERSDGFGEAVHRLGEHLGFPVLAEAASNVRFGFSSTIAMYDAVWRAECTKPDLVLRFGRGLTAKSMISLGVSSIAFSECGQVFDPTHVAQQVIVGDETLACEALMAARGGSGTWRAQWLARERRLRERLSAHAQFDEPSIARDVVGALEAHSNLFVSNSMPIRDVDAFAPTSRGPLHVFSNRGVNGIDGVTSTALGVAAATGRPTTLLIGDVAFLHDLGAWIAARQFELSLNVVVVNNDGGGIFHFLPNVGRSQHFEPFFGTPHGGDLCHVAALAGATLRRPTDGAGLRASLAEAAQQRGLQIIEVRTDRRANVEAHRSLFASLAEVCA